MKYWLAALLAVGIRRIKSTKSKDALRWEEPKKTIFENIFTRYGIKKLNGEKKIWK